MHSCIDFTIIIPAKNEEVNIGNCLRSILAIDFDQDRYEVLVIDNGSRDQTVQVAKSMGSTVFQKPELTIAGLRNFGASQAKGCMLAFLDADCTVAKDWLKEASRYLIESEVAAFGSSPPPPSGATWVQNAWFNIRLKRKVLEDVDWLESMNMFVPRDAFVQAGGFDETLVTCEDCELSKRLGKSGRIVSDQRIRAVHHGEAATLAHFFRKERWRATSNYEGWEKRWQDLSEWPSVFLPVLQLLLCATLALLISLFVVGFFDFILLIVFLLLWQLPVVFLAVWKSAPKGDISTILQLYVLLNVYLLARGWAVFGGGRRY